jgi:hypothetical protein
MRATIAGYTQGTRAFAQDWRHWLEDHRLLLDLVAGGRDAVSTPDATSETRSAATAAAGDSNNSSSSSSSSRHKLGLTQQQAQRLARVPVFLSGESLGGGQSLALGLQLQEEAVASTASTAAATDTAADDTAHNKQQLSVAQRFAGVALLAPAIRGKLPPKLVCTFLRYCIVPLVPERRVPAFLDTVAIPAAVWKREEDIAAYKKDLWGVTPQVLQVYAHKQ